MKQLGIVAVGLALVVGIVVGGIVGNLFGATAQGTSAAAVTSGGCYTNWNGTDCAVGYTALSTGEWTTVSTYFGTSSGTVSCASPKTETSELYNIAGPVSDTVDDNFVHPVSHEPCAICCGTGASVVGGIAELPAVAARSGASGMGSATYAALAGADNISPMGVLGFPAGQRVTLPPRKESG